MPAPVAPPSASRGTGMLILCVLLLVATGIGFRESVGSRTPAASDNVPFSVKSVPPATVVGVQHVYRLGKSVYSGSSPEDEQALKTLVGLGIRTIVSVEAALPDVEAARQYGIRTVHLPMTYREIPRETLIQLARVGQEQVGPFYVHCDDGTQRGPAAAVILWRSLDPDVSAEQGVATLRKLGSTDHPDLAASIRDSAVPTAEELRSTAELPETTHVPPLAVAMARIGRQWKQIRRSVPDRSTITASLRLGMIDDLAESCREASALADVDREMQEGFQEVLNALESLTASIKSDLRTPLESPREAALEQVEDRCHQCHARFRN